MSKCKNTRIKLNLYRSKNFGSINNTYIHFYFSTILSNNVYNIIKEKTRQFFYISLKDIIYYKT